MAIETKNGDFIGLFEDIRVKGRAPNNGITLSRASTEILEEEMRRRREVVPFVEFVDMLLQRAKGKGMQLVPKRLVYELHYDVIKRPEMFLGYILSRMTLWEVLEEDEKIKKGILPPRKQGEGRIVWTERLHIRHETGKVSIFHTDGSAESTNCYVDEFLSKIKVR